MKKLILAVLAIALLIVLARDPQGLGHLVEAIVSVAAKLFNGIAAILSTLLGH